MFPELLTYMSLLLICCYGPDSHDLINQAANPETRGSFDKYDGSDEYIGLLSVCTEKRFYYERSLLD